MTPSPEQETICLSLVHGKNFALKILALCPERIVVRTWRAKGNRKLQQVSVFQANEEWEKLRLWNTSYAQAARDLQFNTTEQWSCLYTKFLLRTTWFYRRDLLRDLHKAVSEIQVLECSCHLCFCNAGYTAHQVSQSETWVRVMVQPPSIVSEERLRRLGML